jgi:hypothetical protein
MPIVLGDEHVPVSLRLVTGTPELMREQRDRTWLRRPPPSGAEPRKARSLYRARIGLAGFGLVLTAGAAVYFGLQFAASAQGAYFVATIIFGLLAIIALVNIIVVSARRRATQQHGL